jgi:hypothetical protein
MVNQYNWDSFALGLPLAAAAIDLALVNKRWKVFVNSSNPAVIFIVNYIYNGKGGFAFCYLLRQSFIYYLPDSVVVDFSNYSTVVVATTPFYLRCYVGPFRVHKLLIQTSGNPTRHQVSRHCLHNSSLFFFVFITCFRAVIGPWQRRSRMSPVGPQNGVEKEITRNKTSAPAGVLTGLLCWVLRIMNLTRECRCCRYILLQ